MEQSPYNRSQEALDTHIGLCPRCKFINPINPKEGLCEYGQKLYRRLRYYAAGNTARDFDDGSVIDGDQNEGQQPRRRAMDKKEVKPWTDTLPRYRMQQLVPAYWHLIRYEIVNNGKLILFAKPADNRMTPRSVIVDLSICTKENHEARREWLEKVIELELLYVVDKV